MKTRKRLRPYNVMNGVTSNLKKELDFLAGQKICSLLILLCSQSTTISSPERAASLVDISLEASLSTKVVALFFFFDVYILILLFRKCIRSL